MKAAGKPVVMLPIILFSDDTSGNRSKKWHLFDSWSVTLAGLPRHENSKIPNIHFCCCSDTVSAMDMCDAIAPELMQLEKEGIEAYDAYHGQLVIILSPLMCIVADNPRASELLNHLGGAARRYCRICIVKRDVCEFNKKVSLFPSTYRLIKKLIQLLLMKNALSLILLR